MLRTFLWGAPTTERGKNAYRDAILSKYRKYFQNIAAAEPLTPGSNATQLREAAIESQAFEAAVQNAETILQRVTDKSSGLLQAIAVAGAFVTVVAPKEEVTSSVANLIGFAVIGLFLGASALLIRNLRLVWYRDASIYEDRDRDLDRVLTLVVHRSVRLAGALLCSMIAVLLLVLVSVVRAWPEVAARLLAGAGYLISYWAALASSYLAL